MIEVEEEWRIFGELATLCQMLGQVAFFWHYLHENFILLLFYLFPKEGNWGSENMQADHEICNKWLGWCLNLHWDWMDLMEVMDYIWNRIDDPRYPQVKVIVKNYQWLFSNMFSAFVYLESKMKFI